MATKTYCDGCGNPMEPGPRLHATVSGGGRSRLVRVESMPSDTEGDFCGDCILDALYALRTPLVVEDVMAPLKAPAQPEREAGGGFSAVPKR